MPSRASVVITSSPSSPSAIGCNVRGSIISTRKLSSRVHAFLDRTFESHSRPVHFGQTVRIESLVAVNLFNFAPHLFGVGFGSQKSDPDFGLLSRIQIKFRKDRGQMQRIAGITWTAVVAKSVIN